MDNDDRYNYRLQDLASGKVLKRMIHCNRLRALNEMDNDYRLVKSTRTEPVYTGLSPCKRLIVNVVIGQALNQQADAIVVYTDDQLKAITDESADIITAAGTSVIEEQLKRRRSAQAGPLVVTNAGELTSVRKIVHVIRDKDSSRQQAYARLLQTVSNIEEIGSIVIPFPQSIKGDENEWVLAGHVAKAILEFDSYPIAGEESLKEITINCTSLLCADVLCPVLKQYLQVTDKIDSSASDATAKEAEPKTDNLADILTDVATKGSEATLNNDGWCTIDRILRQRRYRSRVQYLVKWEGEDKPTWVDRSKVTDYAVQMFLAARKQRRRRRAVKN